MKKEQVTQYDLAAAFKDLDSLEYPEIKLEDAPAKQTNLNESLKSKSVPTDLLLEDTFNINSQDGLDQARTARSDEIAQAKLDRIEKIVDLDANSPEDLKPSYAGKYIIQCPQCMTLFYKNPEDIERSEEDPNIVNINEICQHCGNTSGYELLGKVEAADEPIQEPMEEPAPTEELPQEDHELDMNFGDATEEVDAEGTGEAELSDELNYGEADQAEAEDEKKKEESFKHDSADALNEDFGANFGDIYDNAFSEFEDDTDITVNEPDAVSVAAENVEGEEAEEDENVAVVIEKKPEDIDVKVDVVVQGADTIDDKALIDAVEEVAADTKELDDEDRIVTDVIVVEGDTEAEDKAEEAAEDKADDTDDKEDDKDNDEKKDDKEEDDKEGQKGDDVDESLNNSEVLKDAEKDEMHSENLSNNLTLNESEYKEYVFYTRFTDGKISRQVKADVKPAEIHAQCKEAAESDDVEGVYVSEIVGDKEVPLDKYTIDKGISKILAGAHADEKSDYTDEPIEDDPVDESLNNSKFIKDAEKDEMHSENLSDNLTLNEDADLNKTLKDHNDYIAALQAEVEKEEAAIKHAKNDFIKKMHETNLEKIKTELDAAIPQEVKDAVAANDLPTAEEAGVTEEAAEASDIPAEEAPIEEDPAMQESLETKQPIRESAQAELTKFINSLQSMSNQASNINDVHEQVEEAIEPDHVQSKEEFAQTLKDHDIDTENLTEDTNQEFNAMIQDKEFKKPISDEEVQGYLGEAKSCQEAFDEVEDVKDEEIAHCITEALTSVYENVAKFELTNCEIDANSRFIVEGTIRFKSGAAKNTQYVFTEAIVKPNSCVLKGFNESFNDSKIELTCKVDAKALIAESMKYSWHVGTNLVEGLVK